MCRWLVYQGPQIYVDHVLYNAGHSLIDQSINAREIEWPTNADGFGIGWYADREAPGVLRDVSPIWNDINLRSVAHQVRSGLFFAHIRKATGGLIQRSNCHPFAHGRWLFQHNGSIPDFALLKQRLYARIDPGLFPALQGSTDSECMFLLALSMGLDEDPRAAIAAMIDTVERERRDADLGLDRPFRCTSAFSDGERTFAVRYATAGEPRTLYHSTDTHALCDFDRCDTTLPQGAAILASEPLGAVGGAWNRVEPGHLITVRRGEVAAEPLALP